MDSAFYSGVDDSGQPKDLIAKTGPSFALTNESGTGPFYVTYREHGVKPVFTRFKDYWDTKSPGNVDEIVLTPIKEEATRVAALLSGDVDFIAPVPPQDLERVGSHKDVQLVTMSGTRVINFHSTRSAAPSSPTSACAWPEYAVNNAGIVDRIMKASPPWPPSRARRVTRPQPRAAPRFDLDKAKALMKEAGYEDGFTVTMIAPNNRYVNDEKIAQAVAGMLAKINVKVELKTMPKAQYWDEFDAQVADVQMIGWHADTEDSANFFEYLLMCPNKETAQG
jgi:peptide/nickel transport system substrate-binding protein